MVPDIRLILINAALIALFAGQGFAGEQFLRVSLTDPVSSKSAKPGDTVRARLIADWQEGGKVVAKRGSTITGKVTEAAKARRLLAASIPTKRWLKAGGGVAIVFDTIHAGEKWITVKAVPVGIEGSKDANLVVSKSGDLEQSKKRDLKPKLGRSALGLATLVGAPFTAAIGGAAGAVKPSVVLPEASTKDERKHRRLKGFATGFVAGLPGGFLVNDTVLKGKDTTLPPGTVLKLQNLE